MSTHVGDTFRYEGATVAVVAVGGNDDAFLVRDGEVGIRAMSRDDAMTLGWSSPCTNGEFEAITDLPGFLAVAEPIATAQQFEAGNPVLVDNGREGRVTSVHDGYVWVSVKDPLVNTGWRPANGYHPTEVQHADPTGALTAPAGVELLPPPGLTDEARQRLADDFAALAEAGTVSHAPSSQAGLQSYRDARRAVPALVRLDYAEAAGRVAATSHALIMLPADVDRATQDAAFAAARAAIDELEEASR